MVMALTIHLNGTESLHVQVEILTSHFLLPLSYLLFPYLPACHTHCSNAIAVLYDKLLDLLTSHLPRKAMASSNSLTNHLDGLRARNHQTSGEPTSGYATPSRYGSNYMPTHSVATAGVERPEHGFGLQRRATSDMNKMANLPPIGQQPGPVGQGSQVGHTAQNSGAMQYPLSVSS